MQEAEGKWENNLMKRGTKPNVESCKVGVTAEEAGPFTLGGALCMPRLRDPNWN